MSHHSLTDEVASGPFAVGMLVILFSVAFFMSERKMLPRPHYGVRLGIATGVLCY